MEKLSLRGFQNTYFKDMSLCKFLILTENQLHKQSNVHADLTFKTMTIIHPDVISFTNGDDYLTFTNIKRIDVNREPCLLGTVFNIICSDFTNKSHDISFTIIAQ